MKRIITLLIAIVGALSALMAANTQLFLVGGFSGWDFSPENELSTTDGDYYVATYPTGSEIELSGEFKLADPTWKILNYGGTLSVEVGKSYTLVENAGNLSAVGKIKITKIEFTVSTATLKIIGATSANPFDLSKDQGVSLVESSTNGEKFVSKLTFKSNGVYTGTYTVPNYEFYLKIGGDGNFNTIDYGFNGNYIVLGESYILKKGEMLFAAVYPDEGDWKAGDVFDVKVTFTADWTATLLLTKSTVTPTPEPDPTEPAFVVAGNGGSDATDIWCNGIDWDGTAEANRMKDADKDGIFEITYSNVPAGTWNFKVVVNTEPVQWLGGEFLDAKNSSTGYTIQDGGNIGFSLSNAADVTIKVDSANGKITLTTPSGSFGKAQIEHFTVANGDECLAENRFTAANNNTLKYTENIQILEGNEYGYAAYRILGNCNYAVYEKNLLVEVTEAGIYDITIVFNGDYDNPDFTITAVKQTPVEPDPEPDPTPVPEITDIKVSSFPYTEVGQSSTATATYTLVNATSATATLTGTHAKYFKILSQSVTNGKGTVEIQFTPDSENKYDAVLNIASGSVTVTTSIRAFGVEPAPVPDPVISNIQIASFGQVLIGETKTLVATYTIENATSATASISGAYASYFKILSQSVTGANGSVEIEFAPESEGNFKPTLTITSGKVSENVTLSGLGLEPEIIISNLQKPNFTGAEEDKVSTATATFSLEGAKTATATISGADAAYFKVLSVNVTDGVGTVEMEFAPNISRKYDATLTITAGKETQSIQLSVLAAAPPTQPTVVDLKVSEFTVVKPRNWSKAVVTFTLENSYGPRLSISGLDSEYFSLSETTPEYDNLRHTYIVDINFHPPVAGVYYATLNVTVSSGYEYGEVTASIDFAAICADDSYNPTIEEPVISITDLNIPAFEDTQVTKTSYVTATFKIKGATAVTPKLSGADAGSFKIVSHTVTNGNGEVKIKFVPSKEGEYNATLTIYAGNETVTANLKGKTTAAPEPGPGDDPSDDPDPEPGPGDDPSDDPDPEPGPGDDPSDDPDPEPGPGDDPSDDPDPEPGPGDDPTPDPEPEPEPDPSPYAEYPLIGYFYWVNTGIEYEPDLEWVKTDNSYEPNLEEIESYQPVWSSSIDVDLVPEKLEQKIYGLDIYKFEVRDKEKIPYVRDGYSKSFEFEDVDITKTPYYANGVWYESIEEMMTWYVRYIPYWDDEASEVMIEESPGVFVATLSPAEETDDEDYYYYCLGNVEDPIIVVGIGEYAWNIQNHLQIPQGFKVMAYLEDANWNTYYKLVPPGDAWDKPYIDLGLPSGLCWAVKNLGADKPEDEGLHFAWGEVEPKEDYSYETYKWANQLKNNEFIKYVTDDYYGLIDLRTTLEPNDDAANVALGSKWHIPSKLDTQELLKECTTEFGYYYGVKGYFITGPNGNAIFLPGAVQRKGTNHEERGSGGSYWTSTLKDSNDGRANKLVFNVTYIDSEDSDYAPRTDGLVIRPVIHRDYVAIDEVPAIDVYAKEGTIYSELDFEIYNLTGINVTHLNGSLEGIYIVKTNEGN
ncbi:MAG: hypothetical protein IKL69_01895, partial [Paludibacteraceae bacterium]|nr:hypothetical protein [Paludibacteraceae bacterium]